jgi:hypothetical protein
MTTLTEALHAGAFLVSEANGMRAREIGTIALSQTLVAGQVLGATAVIAGVTSSAAADASNTGNGVFTIDVTAPVAAGAKNGVYRVVNNLVAANGGEFEVFDPDGVNIGRVAVGATFNNQIKFAIADGSTDFAIGDAFSVTVGIEQSDKNYKAFDTTATDGAQHAAGILWEAVTTDGSTKQQATVVVRGCEVRAADLTWPSVSLTAAQKAAAIIELQALGIILR